MLDFNRTNLSSSEISLLINVQLDAGALAEEREARRDYLGASAIGSECLRKVQWDWQRDSTFPARTKRIFARGHAMEEITAKAFAAAGIRMERGTPRTGFSAVGGLFRGHCDGIIIEAPVCGENAPVKRFGLGIVDVPCIWEHKALGSSGWKKIEKDGVRKAYPVYYAQIALYQAYLDLTDNPALFTAVNADTCEIIHELVPFDAQEAQRASDRAVAVIKATQAGELMPRVTTKPDDWRCKFCSHKEECWAL